MEDSPKVTSSDVPTDGLTEIRQSAAEFLQAAEEKRLTLWQEFFYFLSENKKWWLLPMLLTMGAVAALAWFANTGFAPFIYAVW